MRAHLRRIFFYGAILILVSPGMSDVFGQESTETPSVLHIQHAVSTSETGFPQFAYVHQVLAGVRSTLQARALTGTIALENRSQNFSEVLW